MMVRDSGSRYLGFLKDCIRLVSERGCRVIGICHEQKRDSALLRQLAEESGVEDLHIGRSARETKGVIGQCAFIVTSRYHAAASALSQGVPAVTTSWSHKYAGLLEDYDCADLLADEGTPPRETLDRLCDPKGRAEWAKRISGRNQRIEKDVAAMWEDVRRAVLSGQPESGAGSRSTPVARDAPE
jgi:colanic acid/amylovoran biosynthesis protein